MTAEKTPGPIERMLPHGEGAAIPTAQLVALAGCGSARQLQKQIEAERAHGALILSSSTGGYFLPADHEEIRRYEMTLRRRALSTLRTLRAARQALGVVPGKMEVIE